MATRRRRPNKLRLTPTQVSFIAGSFAVLVGIVGFFTLPFLWALGIGGAMFIASFFI